ncbi:MAG: AmmeMemoRadiSam system protein B [Candidatus Gracilibacteria bacterium]
MLTHAILSPHPPALIPAVGKENLRRFEKTVNALLSTAMGLRENPPDTFIILSPHGEIQANSFTIQIPHSENFTADFAEFSAPEVIKTYTRDRLLSAQIVEAATSKGLQIQPTTGEKLDFGVSVPLYYFAAAFPQAQVVSMGISLASSTTHFELGKILREVADEAEKNIVFIASSELAHTLNKFSPHGYSPLAKEWDSRIVADLKAGDFTSILLYDSLEREEIAECGYRGICTLAGVIHDKPAKHQILSYEAPGGIGCAVGVSDLRSGLTE